MLIAAALALTFHKAAHAQQGDAAAGATATPTCAVGNALLEAKQYSEAQKAFVKAMSETPSPQVQECARKGIQQTGEKQAESERKPSPSWTKQVLDRLTELLIAIGLFLIGLLIFLQLARIRPIGRLFLRFPGLGRLVGPRLSLEVVGDEAVEGKPGVPLSARIKKALREARDEVLAEEQSPYDLEHVSPRQEFADLASDNPTVKSGLEKASGLSEQTKLVAALLGLLYALLPTRRFTLSMALSPPTSKAEATLLLEGDARLEATIAVNAQAGGNDATAADYVRLAIPAAVWTEYEVARILADRPLDSGDGLSYVALREGVEQSSDGGLAQAKESYQRALKFNWRNWAAYMGLATVEERAGNLLDSLATLNFALEEMRRHYCDDAEEEKIGDEEKRKERGRREKKTKEQEEREQKRRRFDEAWRRQFGRFGYIADANYYRIGYRLAGSMANAKRVSGQAWKPPSEIDPPAEIARRLLDDANMMVRWCRRRAYWAKGTVWPGLKPSEDRLWHFLTDVVRPGLRILLATEQAQQNLSVAKHRIREIRNIGSAPAADRGTLVDRTHYNLACFEASLSTDEDSCCVETHRSKAIEDLEAAFRKAPGIQRTRLLEEASTDPFLVPLMEESKMRELLGRFGVA